MEKSVFTGHKDVVNCICSTRLTPTFVFCSGSDDKTVRLWDTRTGKKCIKCITGCFDSGVVSIKISPSFEHIMYVATSTALFTFDLRREGLIVKDPICKVESAVRNEGDNDYKSVNIFDDINAIDLSPKEDHVAVVDDSNNVILIPILNSADGVLSNLDENNSMNKGLNPYKRLTRVHRNIVNAVMFNKSNPRQVLTGGFDSQCCLWDVSSLKPLSSHLFEQKQR